MRQSPAFRALTLTLLACAVSGCSNKNSPAASQSPVSAARQAAPDVHASFAAAPAGAVADATADGALSANAKNWDVTIQKASLGKAFLLTAMVAQPGEDPAPSLMNPKVVSFEASGSRIALFELSADAVFDNVPNQRLLQTFPISSQTDTAVTFSWQYGLAVVSTVDMNGPTKGKLDDPDPTLSLASSFVRDISFRDNQMIVKQVARAKAETVSKDDGSTSRGDTTNIVTFVLSPYQTNPNFKPLEDPAGKGVGFFTRAVVEKDGGNEFNLATHWDLSPAAGPVTWAIAKDVPKELGDAMEQGILYWNTVAGREIFKVERNAAPDEVPTFRRATVSYAANDAESSAYANLASDPFTGEVKSALVHVGAGWYTGLGAGFPQILEPNGKLPAPQGFTTARLCDMRAADGSSLQTSLDGLKPNDPAIQRTLLDIMRMVIAHEVGHTLGLRHQFAGSLFSKIPGPLEREAAFADYLGNADHPGAEISSSVMDYFHLEADALGGAYIRKHALSYDSLAFRWAYVPENRPAEPELAQTLFCTDEDADNGNLIGCRRFDSSTKNILQAQAQETQLYFQQLPRALVAGVIGALAPGYGRPHRNLDEVSGELNPDKDQASWLSRVAADAAGGMRSSAVDIWVAKADVRAGWLRGAGVSSASWDAIAQMSAEAGGAPGILRTSLGLPDSMALPQPGWLKAAVKKELAATDFQHVYGGDGKVIALSADEAKSVKEVAPVYADAVESAVTRDLLLLFADFDIGKSLNSDSGKPDLDAYAKFDDVKHPYQPQLVTADWSPKLGALALDVLTRTSGTHDVTVNGVKVTVTDYAFRVDVRTAAARLLAPKLFSAKAAWATDAADAATKTLTANLQKIAAVQTSSDSVSAEVADPGSANAELLAYAKREAQLLGAIVKARAAQ